MNKIFKLSFVFVISLFNYLSSDDTALAKNWYENVVSPAINNSSTKLVDQQLIAHFIELVIEKNTAPSQLNDQKLNGVMNTCPVNNNNICEPIFEFSRERDKTSLKAYYKIVYDSIPANSRTFEGKLLPNPESFNI